MLLSPLVPRTLGGVTEFLADDPSSTGGWNRPYLEQLSHHGFYHFLAHFFLLIIILDKKRKGQPALWSRGPLLDSLSLYIYWAICWLPQLNTQVDRSVQRSLPPIPSFSNSVLGCWWLWGGSAWAASGLAVGGKIQTSGLATTGGQVSYIAAYYSVTPSHIAFPHLFLSQLSNPHPSLVLLHYLG